MRLRRWLNEEEKKEGYVPSHQTGNRGSAETLSAEWRDGTRWALPWARFCAARSGVAQVTLSFGDFELTIHGLNVDQLWDSICDRSLEAVWELPADFVPPVTLKKYRVCVLKLDLRESDSRDRTAPALREDAKPVQTQLVELRI
jgi:hypothetical protein